MRATRSFAICADEYPQQERSIRATTAKSIRCMPNYNVTFASVGKCITVDSIPPAHHLTKLYCCRLKHRDALKGHMLRHVQGPQKCTICGHISPNRKALGKHKQTHNPKRKERFKCTTCGKGCRDKMSLLVNATKLFLENHLMRYSCGIWISGAFTHSYRFRWLIPLRRLRQNIPIQLIILLAQEENAS